MPNVPRVGVESVQDCPQLRTTDLRNKEKPQKPDGILSGRQGDAGYLRQRWSIWGAGGKRRGVSTGTWQWWEAELLGGGWEFLNLGAAVWAQFEQGIIFIKTTHSQR